MKTATDSIQVGAAWSTAASPGVFVTGLGWRPHSHGLPAHPAQTYKWILLGATSVDDAYDNAIRAFVSELWSEDWDSPDDAAYDAM